MRTLAARTFVALLVLATGLLLAACGNDAVSAEPVRTNQVDLPPSYKYDPAVIEVVAGETVTWTNNDHFTHTVQVEGHEDLVIRKGESVSITFDEPGEYDYTCTFHPHDMSGTVIVKAP